MSFKSKTSLEQHQRTGHGLDAVNSNIAQQPSPPPRKRYLIDTENLETSKSSSILSEYTSHLDTTHRRDATELGVASKRARLDSHLSPLQYLNSAIPPHLEAIYEAGTSRMADDKAMLVDGTDGKIILSHTCQVCAKLFPKASDLKRHMMCHTGEKPFRCQVNCYCVVHL